MRNRAASYAAVGVIACLAVAVLAAPAAAYSFKRPLKLGDSGRDVRALQVRVAGFFPRGNHRHFRINGTFDMKTKNAVTAFQGFYGLAADGVAGELTFAMLQRLEDKDGSTAHFDWGEFTQNANSSCSAKANAYAGTFEGGMVAPSVVKKNVRRLMWRLEAIRAKAGGKSIGINSGFRSVAYNDCIGGARSSQHLYGTAADNRVAEIPNRRARNLAKISQVSGIGCYSSLSHNHFDIRLENRKLSSSAFWWWPDRDDAGRDLDESGIPCWGEQKQRAAVALSGTRTLNAVRAALPGSGSYLPTLEELEAFEAAGEPIDLGGAD